MEYHRSEFDQASTNMLAFSTATHTKSAVSLVGVNIMKDTGNDNDAASTTHANHTDYALDDMLESATIADAFSSMPIASTPSALPEQRSPKPTYMAVSPILSSVQAGSFAGYTTDALLDEDNRYSGRSEAQILLEQMERAQSVEPNLLASMRMQEKTHADGSANYSTSSSTSTGPGTGPGTGTGTGTGTGISNTINGPGLPQRVVTRRNRPKAATAGSAELVHQLKMVQLAQGWITHAEAKESLEESFQGSTKHPSTERLIQRLSYHASAAPSPPPIPLPQGSERDDLTGGNSHPSAITSQRLDADIHVKHHSASTPSSPLLLNNSNGSCPSSQSNSPNIIPRSLTNTAQSGADSFDSAYRADSSYAHQKDKAQINRLVDSFPVPPSPAKKSNKQPIRRKRHFRDNTATATATHEQSSNTNSNLSFTQIYDNDDNSNNNNSDSTTAEDKHKSKFGSDTFVLVPSRKSVTMQPFGAQILSSNKFGVLPPMPSMPLVDATEDTTTTTTTTTVAAAAATTLVSSTEKTAKRASRHAHIPSAINTDLEFISTPVLDLSMFTTSMADSIADDVMAEEHSNDPESFLSPIPRVEDITPGEATRAAATFEEMIQPGCTPNLTPAPLAQGSGGGGGGLSPQTPPVNLNSPDVFKDDTIAAATPQPMPYRRKASKFFGVDEHAVAKAAAEQPFTPWFLKNEHTPMDLMYNMEGTVSSGTLRALVDQLTPHDSIADALFTRTFLTCFRLFCKPEEFAQLLYLRYALKPPSNLNNEECKTWLDKKLVPVRLRVFNIVKLWLESYWDAKQDTVCLRDLKRFVAGPVMHMSPLLAKRLLAAMKEKVKRTRHGGPISPRPIWTINPSSAADGNRRSINLDHQSAVAAPLSGILTLFDIEPTELANQITLMEWDLFVLIEPHELIGQAFSKKDDTISPNVKAVVAFTRQLTIWVTETIIFEADLKRRAEILRYFIKLADACFKLGNLDAVLAIITALDSSVLERLSRTWKLISKRNIAILTHLRDVFDHRRNCATYRQTLREIALPCIPFLGLYLRDLTFIDDASSPTIPVRRPTMDNGATSPEPMSNEPRIPFHKYLQSMRLIMEIERFQSSPFQTQPLPRLQSFLGRLLENSETNGDPEKLYFASLRLEQRNAGPENTSNENVSNETDVTPRARASSLNRNAPRSRVQLGPNGAGADNPSNPTAVATFDAYCSLTLAELRGHDKLGRRAHNLNKNREKNAV